MGVRRRGEERAGARVLWLDLIVRRRAVIVARKGDSDTIRNDLAKASR